MIRRIALLAGGLLIVAVVATVGLVTFRAGLAEILLRRQLSAMGISPVQIMVTDLGLGVLRLEDLIIGPTLTVQELSVTYKLPDLFDGRLETVLLEGPRLELDLTGDGPVLGPLEPLLTGEPGGTAAPVPVIRIVGGRLAANTGLGPVTVQLDGRVDPLPDHQMSLSGAYRLESPFGSLAGVVSATGDPAAELLGTLLVDRGTLAHEPLGVAAGKLAGAVAFELSQGRPSQVTVSLSAGDLSVARLTSGEGYLALDFADDLIAVDAALRTADGALDLEVSGEAARGGPGTELRLQGRIVAESLARLGALVSLAEGLTGEIQTSFELSGEFPAVQLSELGTDLLPHWLLRGRLTGTVGAEAENLALGDALQGGRGRVTADLALADRTLTLISSAPSAFAVERLGHDALLAWGLPAPLAGLLTGGATLALAGPDKQARLRVSRGDEAVEVEATGSPILTLPGGAVLEAGGTLLASLRPDLTVRSYGVQDLELRGRALVLGDLEVETLALAGQLRSHDDGLALTGLEAVITGAKVGGTALPAATITGDLSGSLDAATGSLLLDAAAPRVAAGSLEIGAFRLVAPIDLAIAEGALTARLAKPGSIEAARLTILDRLTLSQGGGFILDQARLSVPMSGPGPAPLAFAFQLRPKAKARPWSAALDRRDAPPIRLTVTPGALSWSGTLDQGDRLRTKLSASIRSLTVPAHDLTLSGGSVTGQFDHTKGDTEAEVRIESLGFQNQLGLAEPVGLAGRVTAKGERIAFEGNLTGRAPLDRTKVTAVHRLDRAAGEARVDFGAIDFAPGTLQPRDLSTLLSLLTAVSGAARASAEMAWAKDGVISSGQVKLSDLSFTVVDIKLVGLDLDLRLDDLFRLQSPPAQVLTLARLEGPINVDSVAGAFQVEPGEPARVRFERLDFQSIGGSFSIPGLLLDPQLETHEAVLEVRSLDLDRLTRALEIEGVSGSGNLSGRVPVRFEGGRAVLTDAQLQSTGPGILHYRSAASASLVDELKAETDLDSLDLVNDPFRLTLLALENFHYDSLGVRMGHQADGRANLKLALKGKNPDLLDGYPFELNVNLDTNLTPLLEAIDSGLIVTKDFLPETWRFGR